VITLDLPHARRLAFICVRAQLLVTVLAAVVSWGVAGPRGAYSALLGGGASTLASLVMALLAFGRLSGSSAERMLLAFYLGEIAYHQGDFTNAITAYSAVLDKFPGNPKAAAAQLRKGLALIQTNKKDAGIRELRQLIQRHPQTPEATQELEAHAADEFAYLVGRGERHGGAVRGL